jgi:hypothetical protein
MPITPSTNKPKIKDNNSEAPSIQFTWIIQAVSPTLIVTFLDPVFNCFLEGLCLSPFGLNL